MPHATVTAERQSNGGKSSSSSSSSSSRRLAPVVVLVLFLAVAVLIVFVKQLQMTAGYTSELAGGLRGNTNNEAPLLLQQPQTTASSSSGQQQPQTVQNNNQEQQQPQQPLYTVTHEFMTELRRHMNAAMARNAQEFVTHNGSIMLQFLRDQAQNHGKLMVPMLDTVPVTAHAHQIDKSKGENFVGQELEDQILYTRFWNEHTTQCHGRSSSSSSSFGNTVFESGAYHGVEWSNTYFFEKHFERHSILVEASPSNWGPLDAAVRAHRPHATVHHQALCPVGDTSVCLDSSTANAKLHSAMHGVQRQVESAGGDGTSVSSSSSSCQNSIPCFDFDDTIHYGLVSLDIEGFEWEFLKFRNIQADLIIIEFAQWLRRPHQLLTAVEVLAHLAQMGYYLYAPAARSDMVGVRNFVFVGHSLVEDCFAQYKISATTPS